MVHSDEGGGFKADFAKLCTRHHVHQEFTTAYSAKFNGVGERHIAVAASADAATQEQAQSLLRGFKTSFGSRLWSTRSYWACHALNRTASSSKMWDKSSFKMYFRTVPQSPISFLMPGYMKTALDMSMGYPSQRALARLPATVTVSTENAHFVCVGEQGKVGSGSRWSDRL